MSDQPRNRNMPHSVPTPGERLSTSEVRSEAGVPVSDRASSANTRASDPGGVREKGLTAEALRHDHSGAAESGAFAADAEGAAASDPAVDDEEAQRAAVVRARVEGLIGNPD